MMKLYLLVEFDLKLSCDDKEISLKTGEIVFCDIVPFEINVFPKEKFLMPYSLRCFSDYSIECCSANIKKLNGAYFVELKPLIYYSPEFKELKEIKFNNETYKIEFYNQFNGLVQIYNNKDKYLYKFKENFGLDYYIKTICDKQFLFVKIFNDNKQFYFIFDKSKLIFSGDVKEINITLEKLIIMRNDINCFGQKRVVEINIKEDKLEEYLIYYDERKHLENINFLYLFLDAIKVKNYDSCCCYLSNELKAIDKDSLFGYFDDFDDYLFIEDACLLKKNNEVIKIVHFEVFNNLILDITD